MSRELSKLPDEIEDKLLEVLSYLEDEGLADPYDYVGYSHKDKAKPYLISFGGIPLAEIKFCMNTRSNGDCDGCEGNNFNYFVEED